MLDMNQLTDINFREHPLGFTIVQEKNVKQGLDDNHIFFHGNKLHCVSAIEEIKGIAPKKLRSLKQSTKKSKSILQALQLESKTMLLNPRYNESYLRLGDSYFSITQSGKKEYKGEKFKTFVTNGCLFGTNIQGIQENGTRLPLIDHKLQIQSPIIDIVIQNGFHLYERNIFENFSKHLLLMKRISTDSLCVVYHLPIIDYMLSAIKLYIQGNMSGFALEKYIEAIKMRGEGHKIQLETIAKKNGVPLVIHSPFANLINPKVKITAKILLSTLQLDSENSTPHGIEKTLVKNVLNLLISNEYFPEIQKIWQKLSPKNSKSIHDLKDVLGMANASVISYAAGKNPNEKNRTCVWLPADEYPVFKHYKKSMGSMFGEVICFSFIPTMLNYVRMNKDGADQQTLFRYRSNSLAPTITASRLIWEHNYLNVNIFKNDVVCLLILLAAEPHLKYIIITKDFCKIINEIVFFQKLSVSRPEKHHKCPHLWHLSKKLPIKDHTINQHRCLL